MLKAPRFSVSLSGRRSGHERQALARLAVRRWTGAASAGSGRGAAAGVAHGLSVLRRARPGPTISRPLSGHRLRGDRVEGQCPASVSRCRGGRRASLPSAGSGPAVQRLQARCGRLAGLPAHRYSSPGRRPRLDRGDLEGALQRGDRPLGDASAHGRRRRLGGHGRARPPGRCAQGTRHDDPQRRSDSPV